jgi:hypothetical protein
MATPRAMPRPMLLMATPKAAPIATPIATKKPGGRVFLGAKGSQVETDDLWVVQKLSTGACDGIGALI